MMIVLDDLVDEPFTDEQKRKMLAWFDATFSHRDQRKVIIMPGVRFYDDTPPKIDK